MEVNDRIFSTAVDLQYVFAPVDLACPTDDKKLELQLGTSANGTGTVWDAVGVAERARKVTLEVFAQDQSASVQVCLSICASPAYDLCLQATLYKMAQLLLTQNAGIQSVTYALPNKHYIPVDMRYLGVENVSPP